MSDNSKTKSTEKQELNITSISKSYSRKVSIDYQTWGFQTMLTSSVEINSKKELAEEGKSLFAAAKKMTESDIAKVEEEIKSQSNDE